MTKIGIVLSGGGIRGIAHLGVLKALMDAGIRFSHISGTSAGAIAGAFCAAGIDPLESLHIFMKTRLLRFVRPALSGLGIINIERTRDIFSSYFSHENIEDLDIPLTICTTNFSEGELVYFDKGPLIPAILASSCIPGIFKPITINKQMYVDGGVLNNFPVEPLLDNCDYIIGSSCNHLLPVEKVSGFSQLIQRAGIMSLNHDMERKAKYCQLLIEPIGMGQISTFDMKKAETIYWLAHEEALNRMRDSGSFQNLLKTIH